MNNGQMAKGEKRKKYANQENTYVAEDNGEGCRAGR
jgi:hypothetical protein